MQYTFTVAAILRITQILNVWPCSDRATYRAIDEVATKLELTATDREAVGWREQDGYARFIPDATIDKELDDLDVGLLRRMAENPPERLAWTRSERELQAAIFEPLGIELWL